VINARQHGLTGHGSLADTVFIDADTADEPWPIR